jgi:hypothetical protein
VRERALRLIVIQILAQENPGFALNLYIKNTDPQKMASRPGKPAQPAKKGRWLALGIGITSSIIWLIVRAQAPLTPDPAGPPASGHASAAHEDNSVPGRMSRYLELNSARVLTAIKSPMHPLRESRRGLNEAANELGRYFGNSPGDTALVRLLVLKQLPLKTAPKDVQNAQKDLALLMETPLESTLKIRDALDKIPADQRDQRDQLLGLAAQVGSGNDESREAAKSLLLGVLDRAPASAASANDESNAELSSYAAAVSGFLQLETDPARRSEFVQKLSAHPYYPRLKSYLPASNATQPGAQND